ncbi:MAG: hydrogenase nickel incorporation protein HypB [Candidatus Methanomethylophilaceae archaeon]|nr:hydrogenase nickel incorporation protein HypB [Candidatus Methanomethylophilaceae archaeon]
MHMITDVSMEFDVLRENNKIAHENYRLLQEHGITSVDFMGSIGAGKTAMIIKLAEKLRAKGLKVAAIAGDVTGVDDFSRMKDSGIKAVNCNTGKDCHLTADMIHKKLHEMDLENIDVLFIENVGNLVCPADFPLGTDFRVVVISTTEGDDMVRKHPDIFLHSDLAILNKVDIAEAVDVDPEVITKDYERLTGGNKHIFKTSVKKDMGLDEILKAMEL